MKKLDRLTRRDFLHRAAGASAAVIAAPLILPAAARGANDRINVGYIGVGRRARQVMGLPGDMEIVAVSDVNTRRMDEVAGTKPWRKYQDYRELLAQDDIDAVVVATPDHWHALNSVHACEAGKDVYVEKPMTLTIREGRAMVEAARKHGRIVQVGSQQRSMEQCRLGCEIVRNRLIGDVTLVHGSNYQSPWDCPLPAQDTPDCIDWDAWCGQTEPRPFHEELYLPRVRNHEAGWISYTPYSGGEMTGWGAHGLDIIQWALGQDLGGPVAVEPLLDKVPPPDGEHMGPTCQVRYTYADGTVLVLDDEGPGGGGVFEGTKGQVRIDRGRYDLRGVEIGARDIECAAIKLDVSTDHLGNWRDCIRSRALPIADVEIGHRSTTVCHLGNIARWLERPLKWDPDREQFVDDAEANGYVARKMRAPYVLPGASAWAARPIPRGPGSPG